MAPSCNKVGYTRVQAKTAAASHRRRFFSNMTHYRCSKCYHKPNSWHLTSQVKRRGARRVKYR